MLSTYVLRMNNSNLEIKIADSTGRQQLNLVNKIHSSSLIRPNIDKAPLFVPFSS